MKLIIIIFLIILKINLTAQRLIISNKNDSVNLLIYDISKIDSCLINSSLIAKSFSNWNKINLGDVISITTINDSLFFVSNSKAIYKINCNTGAISNFIDLPNTQINFYKNNLYVCNQNKIYRIDLQSGKILQTFDYLNNPFTSSFCYRDRLFFAIGNESYTHPSDGLSNSIYSTKLSDNGAIYYDDIKFELSPQPYKFTNYSNPIKKIKIKNDTLIFIENDSETPHNNRVLQYILNDNLFKFNKIYEMNESGNFSYGLAFFENKIIATGGNLINSNDSNLFGFEIINKNSDKIYLQDLDNDLKKNEKNNIGDVEILQNECINKIEFDTFKVSSQSQIITLPIKIISDSNFILFTEFNKLDFELISITNKFNDNLELNYYENKDKILIKSEIKDTIIYIDLEVFLNDNKNKIIKLFTKNCCDTSIIDINLSGCEFLNRDLIFINDKLKIATK